jgi:hypothetical protein
LAGGEGGSAGGRVREQGPDVVLGDDFVLDEEILRERLAVEQVDHGRDEDRAVAVREVGRVRKPAWIPGDLLPGRRVRALAGQAQLALATRGARRGEGAQRHVVVEAEDRDDAAGRDGRQLVAELLERQVGGAADVDALELVVRDRAAGLLEAGDHAVHAGQGRGAGALGVEGDHGLVVAVVLGLEGIAHVLAGDGAGERVVGTHERDLAGLLDDVDGDGRQVAVGGADLGRAVLEQLEVEDGLDLLDLQVLGAGDGLGGIDLGVAHDDLDTGLLGLLEDAVGHQADERDRLAERDIADLHGFGGRGCRGGGCRLFGGGCVGRRRRVGRCGRRGRRIAAGGEQQCEADQEREQDGCAHRVVLLGVWLGWGSVRSGTAARRCDRASLPARRG